MCRVEFFKIGKRDVTFIREMRVYEENVSEGKLNWNMEIVHDDKKSGINKQFMFCFFGTEFQVGIKHYFVKKASICSK